MDLEKEARGVTADRLWRDNNSSTCEVVSTLIEILSNCEEPDLNENVIFILGSLGGVNFHSLQHGRLPYHHRDPYRVNHFKVEDVKTEIFMRAYKLMWASSINVAISAMFTLKSLKLANEFSVSVCNSMEPDVSQYYADINKLYPAEMLKDHDIERYSMFDHCKLRRTLMVSGRGVSIQDSSTWDMITAETPDWDEWICRLVSCMILDCYCEGGSLTTRMASSSGTVLSSSFFESFLTLSSIRSDVAELIFPLLCFDVVTSLGTDHEFISQMISYTMLSPKINLEVPQATRLGIRTIVFILKEDVSTFVMDPLSRTSPSSLTHSTISSGKKRKPAETSKEANVSNDGKQILPFNISIQIDLGHSGMTGKSKRKGYSRQRKASVSTTRG